MAGVEDHHSSGANKRPKLDDRHEVVKVRGIVKLTKKKILDGDNLIASATDWFDELLNNNVSLQLISATVGRHDPKTGFSATVGKPANLKKWLTTLNPLTADEVEFKVTFHWSEDQGVPGAFIIRNNHHNEFYLKSLTLNNVPGNGEIHFVCNSWVYPANKYQYDRIFFSNQTYLPSETPIALRKYREQELMNLRGNGVEELQEWDRVYDYAVYNDLGNPDKGSKYERPTLGGSLKYPYPRRGRTSRPPCKTDPTCESRIHILKSIQVYVPRDERFSHLKLSDVVAYGLKALGPFILAEAEDIADGVLNEFNTLEDTLAVYEGGIKLPSGNLLNNVRKSLPCETLREILRNDGERFMKFPMPHVIAGDKYAWRTDEEFAREMIAGMNPISISRLQEVPHKSKLDPQLYGDNTSKITKDILEKAHGGINVDEAIESNKLYILDHHDSMMPFISRINKTSTKGYATRTVLLKEDGILKPLAIELSIPDPKGDKFGPISEIYFPAKEGTVEGSIWQLAKAYVATNDTGIHQLCSHWLNTHCVMEPFIIATNRQLSVLHPIYKLLHPHFRDTMYINALGRQILVNAGGALENTVFPGKYSMEITSNAYKNWVFTDQALPADLLKRGMAVKDSSSPHGLRLLVEDYPYAVDGLEIWSAIETWVRDYCSVYYKDDEKIRIDSELQSWWNEVRYVGHGDKKEEPWWPKMQCVEELIQSCTTIIWIASALHAAINFSQYPYGGYLPNRPSLSRRLIPKPGTNEYKELEANPEKFFLRTITSQFQTLLGISLIELLSRHASDEVFLGQRERGWTEDKETLEAFDRFREKLVAIEKGIVDMNGDEKWRNRTGPVNMPYTVLIPSSEVGLTFRGIPNSVSM
ncbi:unnamed protein product [Rhodiola kirilowii]